MIWLCALMARCAGSKCGCNTHDRTTLCGSVPEQRGGGVRTERMSGAWHVVKQGIGRCGG